jgi:hypothetical protein
MHTGERYTLVSDLICEVGCAHSMFHPSACFTFPHVCAMKVLMLSHYVQWTRECRNIFYFSSPIKTAQDPIHLFTVFPLAVYTCI